MGRPLIYLDANVVIRLLAIFLAGNASSIVTGATLVVDGGFTLW